MQFPYTAGLLMKLPIFDRPHGSMRPIMDDELWWETPEEFHNPPEKASKLLNDSHPLDDTNI